MLIDVALRVLGKSVFDEQNWRFLDENNQLKLNNNQLCKEREPIIV